MAINRKQAREAAFTLLFETEFKAAESREEIFSLSTQNRDIEEDSYIREVYFGVCEHIKELDAFIGKYAKGWKPERISRVSRYILRLAIFEMLYLADIPLGVSINEAVELCKKFDEEGARPFVNGILNSVKEELENA